MAPKKRAAPSASKSAQPNKKAKADSAKGKNALQPTMKQAMAPTMKKTTASSSRNSIKTMTREELDALRPSIFMPDLGDPEFKDWMNKFAAWLIARSENGYLITQEEEDRVDAPGIYRFIPRNNDDDKENEGLLDLDLDLREGPLVIGESSTAELLLISKDLLAIKGKPNAITEYYCIGHGPENSDAGGSELDEDEDEEEAQMEVALKQSREVTGKPAEQFPNWKWIMTEAGFTMYQRMTLEDERRDGERMGCYFYNDWMGYGMLETMENTFEILFDEFSKEEFNLQRFWCYIEGFAMYLHSHDRMFYFMNLDDGERAWAWVHVTGMLALTALDKLEQAGELKDHSSFKNWRLIMSLYLEFLADANEVSDDIQIEKPAAQLVAYMDHHKIEINNKTGVSRTEARVKKMRNSKFSYNKLPKVKDDRFNLTKVRKDYITFNNGPGAARSSKFRLGGTAYDLTKMSKAERIDAAFDKKDPYTAKVRKYFEDSEKLLRGEKV